MGRKEVEKLRNWDTYNIFRNVISIILMIIGCILFRVYVLSGWHLIDGFSGCENFGDVILAILELIIMEILPLVVAFIPGGLGGGIVGWVASSALSLLFMLIFAISIGIYDIVKWIQNKNRLNDIKRTRKRISKKCDYISNFINKVLEIVGNVEEQNKFEDLTKLFNYMSSTVLYDEYLAKRNSIDTDKITKVRYMAMTWKINMLPDKWSLNSVYNWCVEKNNLISKCKREMQKDDLVNLKSTLKLLC